MAEEEENICQKCGKEAPRDILKKNHGVCNDCLAEEDNKAGEGDDNRCDGCGSTGRVDLTQTQEGRFCPDCLPTPCQGKCGQTYPARMLDENGLCQQCRESEKSKDKYTADKEDNRTAGEKEADEQIDNEALRAAGYTGEPDEDGKPKPPTAEQRAYADYLKEIADPESMKQYRDELAKRNDNAAYRDYLVEIAGKGGTGLTIDEEEEQTAAGMDWLDNNSGGGRKTQKEYDEESVAAGMNWLGDEGRPTESKGGEQGDDDESSQYQGKEEYGTDPYNVTGDPKEQKQENAQPDEPAETNDGATPKKGEEQDPKNAKKQDGKAEEKDKEKNFADFLQELFEKGEYEKFREMPGVKQAMDMLNQSFSSISAPFLSLILHVDKVLIPILSFFQKWEYIRTTKSFEEMVLYPCFKPDDPFFWLGSFFRPALDIAAESPGFKQAGDTVMKAWNKMQKASMSVGGGGKGSTLDRAKQGGLDAVAEGKAFDKINSASGTANFVNKHKAAKSRKEAIEMPEYNNATQAGRTKNAQRDSAIQNANKDISVKGSTDVKQNREKNGPSGPGTKRQGNTYDISKKTNESKPNSSSGSPK